MFRQRHPINYLKQEHSIQTEAQKLEAESLQTLYRHELFARSVAALQVGIAPGAVAALLRRRSVWYLGLGIAAIGISFMIIGILPLSQAPNENQSVRSES